jgi:prepilin-type N-terminal cleavage/methylation domain-containing protein
VGLRQAFTLVELLVVITIIGVLMGLLIPAVQSAREAARRSQCGNNLKNIALAFQQHEGTYKQFPDGGESAAWTFYRGPPYSRDISAPNPMPAPNQDWGWGYQILSFLELDNLWKNTNDGYIRAFPIPVYFCPSKASRPHTIASSTLGATVASTLGATVATIDYAGNGGFSNLVDIREGSGSPPVAILLNPNQGNGLDGVVVRRPFQPWSVPPYPPPPPPPFLPTPVRSQPVSLSCNSIPDGTSNTLLVAEKAMNTAKMGTTQIDDSLGYVDGWGCETVRWGSFQPVPDWADAAETSKRLDPYHSSFGSSHPGVFQAAFCDGMVRPIRFSVNGTIFQYLCQRNDSQAVDTSGL